MSLYTRESRPPFKNLLRRAALRISALAAATAAVTVVSPTAAQCPDYSNGTASAGLSQFNGGEDARLIYVDCLPSIAFIDAKFGIAGGSSQLDGLPLTLAVYDDPNDDLDPGDAALVWSMQIPGGVTGGNTGEWQRYDLFALSGATVPATGGMFVAVGVQYGAGVSPGPGSIEFGNNIPGRQWLASDTFSGAVDYTNMLANNLRELSTGPGFPPGSWVVRAQSGADYRPFGTGCAGSNGTPALTYNPATGTAPVLGQPMELVASSLPDPGTPTVIAFGLARFHPPVALDVIGGTGCSLYPEPLVTVPVSSTGGSAAWVMFLTSDAAYAGRSLYCQAWTADVGANLLGVTTSNGLEAVLGR